MANQKIIINIHDLDKISKYMQRNEERFSEILQFLDSKLNTCMNTKNKITYNADDSVKQITELYQKTMAEKKAIEQLVNTQTEIINKLKAQSPNTSQETRDKLKIIAELDLEKQNINNKLAETTLALQQCGEKSVTLTAQIEELKNALIQSEQNHQAEINKKKSEYIDVGTKLAVFEEQIKSKDELSKREMEKNEKLNTELQLKKSELEEALKKEKSDTLSLQQEIEGLTKKLEVNSQNEETIKKQAETIKSLQDQLALKENEILEQKFREVESSKDEENRLIEQLQKQLSLKEEELEKRFSEVDAEKEKQLLEQLESQLNEINSNDTLLEEQKKQEINELTAKFESEKALIQTQLAEEKARLQAQLDQEKAQTTELETQLQQIKSDNTKSEQEKQDQISELTKGFESEKALIQAQLEEEKTRSTQLQKNLSTEKEFSSELVEELRIEKEKRNLAEQVLINKKEELENRLALALREGSDNDKANRELIKDLEKKIEIANADIENEKAKFTFQIGKLEESLRVTQREKERSDVQIKSIRDELNQKNDEIALLERQIKANEVTDAQQVRKYQERIAQKENDINSLNSKLEAEKVKNKEIDELRSRLKSAESENTKNKDEHQKLNRKIDELNSKQLDLLAEVEEGKKAQALVQTLSADIQVLQQEKTGLQEAVKQKELSEEQLEQAKIQIKSLESSLKNKEKEFSELEKQANKVEGLEKKIVEFENERLESQNKIKELEARNLENIKNLEGQLTTKNREIVNLKRDYDNLIQEKLVSDKKNAEEYTSLQLRNETLNKEKAELQTTNNEIQAKLEKSNAQLQSNVQEVQNLRDKIKKRESETGRIESELRISLESLENEGITLKQNLQNIENEKQVLQNSLNEMTEKQNLLQKRVESIQEDNNKKNIELENNRLQIEEIQFALQTEQDERRDEKLKMEEELEKLMQMEEKSSQQVDELIIQYNESLQKVGEVSDKNEELEKQLEAIKIAKMDEERKLKLALKTNVENARQLSENVAALKAREKDLQEMAKINQNEIGVISKRKKELEKDLENARKSEKEKEDRILQLSRDLEKNIESSIAANEALKKQNMEKLLVKDTEIKTLSESNKLFQEEGEKAKLTINNKEIEIQNLKQKLRQKIEDYQKLKSDFDNETTRLRTLLAEEKNTSSKEIKKLKADIQDKVNKISLLTMDFESVSKVRDNVLEEITDLTNRYNEMSSRCSQQINATPKKSTWSFLSPTSGNTMIQATPTQPEPEFIMVPANPEPKFEYDPVPPPKFEYDPVPPPKQEVVQSQEPKRESGYVYVEPEVEKIIEYETQPDYTSTPPDILVKDEKPVQEIIEQKVYDDIEPAPDLETEYIESQPDLIEEEVKLPIEQKVIYEQPPTGKDDPLNKGEIGDIVITDFDPLPVLKQNDPIPLDPVDQKLLAPVPEYVPEPLPAIPQVGTTYDSGIKNIVEPSTEIELADLNLVGTGLTTEKKSLF